MKILTNLIGCILLFLPGLLLAEVKEIPFTIDDRDRIIRTEQKVENLNTKIDAIALRLDNKIDSKVDGLRFEMNARFEAADKRFDQLFNFLWAIIGIFTAMMISVFGFAFWDRKLSLSPLRLSQKHITTKNTKDFTKALKE